MPSPFPGMDPYLESASLWPEFQCGLVRTLHQILLPGLTDRYQAIVAQRDYPADGPPPAAIQSEPFIEIRHRSDGKLVTLLDVVSLANRTTANGRNAYLETRRTAKEAGANLVELDLVRAGQPLLTYSRDGLPDWDYAITISRAPQLDRFEIYTSTLQRRLPRCKLPFAADDRDMVIDLQTAFVQCYDHGKYADRIDYGDEPPVSVNPKHRTWVRELLGLAPHDAIAVAAYYIWLREGCPHGRDKEHWRQAITELKPRADRSVTPKV